MGPFAGPAADDGASPAAPDRPGVVDHGLFLHMADEVILATASGVEVIGRSAG